MLVNYSNEYEQSLIQAYIETFSGDPWNETWDHEWVLNRIRWVSKVPNFIGKIAIENGRVVGALLGYGIPFREKMDFDILELFVLPTHQGNGLGKALVNELENSLPHEKYGAVHLVTATNTNLEEFYKKCGYDRNDKLCLMVHRL